MDHSGTIVCLIPGEHAILTKMETFPTAYTFFIVDRGKPVNFRSIYWYAHSPSSISFLVFDPNPPEHGFPFFPGREGNRIPRALKPARFVTHIARTGIGDRGVSVSIHGHNPMQ